MCCRNHLVASNEERACSVAVPVDGTQVWREASVLERGLIVFVVAIVVVVFFLIFVVFIFVILFVLVVVVLLLLRARLYIFRCRTRFCCFEVSFGSRHTDLASLASRMGLLGLGICHDWREGSCGIAAINIWRRMCPESRQ